MKYYLINTFDNRGEPTVFRPIGSLVSWHKTEEAAIRAQAQLLRAIRRHNGPQSYLPTVILTSNDCEIRGGWPYPVFTDDGVYRMEG